MVFGLLTEDFDNQVLPFRWAGGDAIYADIVATHRRPPPQNPRVVNRKMFGYQLKHAHRRAAPTINRRPVVTS
jgi:hypothetical protein